MESIMIWMNKLGARQKEKKSPAFLTGVYVKILSFFSTRPKKWLQAPFPPPLPVTISEGIQAELRRFI